MNISGNTTNVSKKRTPRIYRHKNKRTPNDYKSNKQSKRKRSTVGDR